MGLSYTQKINGMKGAGNKERKMVTGNYFLMTDPIIKEIFSTTKFMDMDNINMVIKNMMAFGSIMKSVETGF